MTDGDSTVVVLLAIVLEGSEEVEEPGAGAFMMVDIERVDFELENGDGD